MSTLKDIFLKWAGIGSRETPEWVFPLFIAIGWHMASLNSKLYSGAAPGPDTEFERGTIRFMRDNNVRNLMEIWLPWRTFGKRKGIDGNHYKVLDKPDFDFARHILNDSGVCVNPWFVKMGRGAQALYARNVYQILTSDWTKVDLVIYYASENFITGTLKGGTRVAVELARTLEIPCFNLAIPEDVVSLCKMISFDPCCINVGKNMESGEIFFNNDGQAFEIKEYIDNKTVRIQFKVTGKERTATKDCILKGKVKDRTHLENLVGKTFKTRKSGRLKIVDYRTSSDVTVLFPDTGYRIESVTMQAIRSGLVKDPYHPTIAGRGFIGEGTATDQDPLTKKAYHRWRSMLARCYDTSHPQYDTYRDCEVAEDWLNFQNYLSWFKANAPEDFTEWDVDKDLKSYGLGLYSPETCCFLPREINSLLTNLRGTKKSHPGILCTKSGKYQARYGQDQLPKKSFEAFSDAFEYYWDCLFQSVENRLKNYPAFKEREEVIVRLKLLKQELSQQFS